MHNNAAEPVGTPHPACSACGEGLGLGLEVVAVFNRVDGRARLMTVLPNLPHRGPTRGGRTDPSLSLR